MNAGLVIVIILLANSLKSMGCHPRSIGTSFECKKRTPGSDSPIIGKLLPGVFELMRIT